MLRGSSLRYYEKKPEFVNRKSATKPKGELIIDAHAVAEAHKAEDSPWESFQVTTTANGSKNLAVFAESRTEKEHWLRILQAVIRGDDPTPFVDAPIVLDDDASGNNNGSTHSGAGAGAGAGAGVSMPSDSKRNKIGGLARFRAAAERVRLQNRCAMGFYRGLTVKALHAARVVFSGYLKKLPQKVIESAKGAKGAKAKESAWQRRFFVLARSSSETEKRPFRMWENLLRRS